MTSLAGPRRLFVAVLAVSTLTATAAGAKAPVAPVIPSPVASPPGLVHQLGGAGSDDAAQVALDGAGNAYVLGKTNEHLNQSPENQTGTIFVAKYGAAGNLVWVRQFGAMNIDNGCSIVADATGNVTVVGYTRGATANTTWLAHFASDGTFGSQVTLAVPSGGCAPGAAALDHQGNLYYAGGVPVTIPPGPGISANPIAALLVRVNADDGVVWTRQLSGTDSVWSTDLALDAHGNLYLAGDSDGVVDGANDHLVGGLYTRYGFVARYDVNGGLHWVHEFGNSAATSQVDVYGATVDANGNIAVAGRTNATLVGSPDDNPGIGQNDAFVVVYSASGRLRWIRQLGAERGPSPGAWGKYGTAIAAQPDGDLVMAGDTINPPDGQLGQPDDEDAFAAEFDPHGALVGYDEVASPGRNEDAATGVAVDQFANVTVVGVTWGTMAGSAEVNAGEDDAFVLHYQAESTASIADAKAHATSASQVLQFTVTLDQASVLPFVAHVETHDGTAIGGVDYVPVSGTLGIAAGATSVSIPVTVNPSSHLNGQVKFTVVLTDPLGAVLARATATGTIIEPRH